MIISETSVIFPNCFDIFVILSNMFFISIIYKRETSRRPQTYEVMLFFLLNNFGTYYYYYYSRRSPSIHSEMYN